MKSQAQTCPWTKWQYSIHIQICALCINLTILFSMLDAKSIQEVCVQHTWAQVKSLSSLVRLNEIARKTLRIFTGRCHPIFHHNVKPIFFHRCASIISHPAITARKNLHHYQSVTTTVHIWNRTCVDRRLRLLKRYQLIYDSNYQYVTIYLRRTQRVSPLIVRGFFHHVSALGAKYFRKLGASGVSWFGHFPFNSQICAWIFCRQPGSQDLRARSEFAQQIKGTWIFTGKKNKSCRCRKLCVFWDSWLSRFKV